MDDETLAFIEDNLFPLTCLKERINVIGAGATGSRVVLNLAKMGFENMHVWDFDKIEKHNIYNQFYQKSDIGKFKVIALGELVKNFSDVKIKTHNEFFQSAGDLEGIVFLLVDTLLSRKEIWKNCLRENKKIKLVIETRIGQESGDVFVINPNKEEHVRAWEKTIFRNFPPMSPRLFLVNPIVEIVSGLATQQLIKWCSLNFDNKKENNLSFENEIKVVFKDGLKFTVNYFDNKKTSRRSISDFFKLK